MAFIEVRTQDADFRWILGGHWKRTNPSQLPPNFTGLLVEIIYEQPAHFYKDIQDIQGKYKPYNCLVEKQFRSLIDVAKEARVPIASLDPITNVNAFRKRELTDQGTITEIIKKYPLSLLHAMIASAVIDFSPKEVKKGTWLYDSMVRHSDNMTSLGYSVISYRDLVMSQRAWVLAQHQLSQGVQRPFIVAASGTLHICGARNLELTAEERWQKIRCDPSYNEFVRDKQLGRIQIAQYSKERKTWSKKIIEDQAQLRR